MSSFFCNFTSTSDFYTLSLHDALPIFFFSTGLPSKLSTIVRTPRYPMLNGFCTTIPCNWFALIASIKVWLESKPTNRSEEHTSELQSQFHLVCRLLLEKKNEK